MAVASGLKIMVHKKHQKNMKIHGTKVTNPSSEN